jgi:hypothetical protein
MPYKDVEDRRRYDRDRKRRLRAVRAEAPSALDLASNRDGVTEALLGLVAEAVTRVRRDPKARGVEKGREIGRLVGVALRVVETRDLAERLEAIERVMERRRAG